MRNANILLLTLAAAAGLLTACPRQEGADATGEAAATGSSAATDAQGGLSLPHDYLALGEGMTAAPLPATLVDDYPDTAEVNADGTVMVARFPANGMEYWFQAFKSDRDAEQLRTQFDTVFLQEGYERGDFSVDGGSLEANWTAREGDNGIRVYRYNPEEESPLPAEGDDAAAAPADPGAQGDPASAEAPTPDDGAETSAAGDSVYILFFQDLGQEQVVEEDHAAEAPAEEGAAAEEVPHDHDGDGVSDHGEEAHSEGG
jgi:hypothetical protein